MVDCEEAVYIVAFIVFELLADLRGFEGSHEL